MFFLFHVIGKNEIKDISIVKIWTLEKILIYEHLNVIFYRYPSNSLSL
jgi:hypothetical protein